MGKNALIVLLMLSVLITAGNNIYIVISRPYPRLSSPMNNWSRIVWSFKIQTQSIKSIINPLPHLWMQVEGYFGYIKFLIFLWINMQKCCIIMNNQ
ncbi:hypothetical protein BK141_12975 [Paenibacillus sp. FSL R5-0765]|nr:hypothetical protein BK141_12975 [Paenibacillus sp. FSL R5-0765]